MPVARAATFTGLVGMCGVGIVTALIVLAGGRVDEVVSGWVQGAFGTPRNAIETVAYTTPLVLIALGAVPALRAGVVVIGAEGQMIVGAIAAAAVVIPWGTTLGWLAVPLGALLGAVGGSTWSLLPALPQARWGAPEILTALLANYLAAEILTGLLRTTLRDPGAATAQSHRLPAAAMIPALPGRFSTAVLLVLVVLAMAMWWYRSRAARLVDIYAQRPWLAARAGVVSSRTVLSATCASGAAAGLAGWIQLAGVEGVLHGGISGGIGFTGLVVAILGRGRPILTVLAGLGVASLTTGAAGVELATGVPSAIGQISQAVLLVTASLAIVVVRRQTYASGATDV
ncbi:hypothetical protein DL991_10710 [Amycolatopsis sp. WAC 01375]|uniref:ABC transporter permease n=1 Tax=Amycolatopsis sp. WAC 01375 TaxID=2203194 RepID=UPI000F7A6415|nr:ABC transporter permease [Amycolatopsis sp. WAC 01375]RSM80573.1 hypothetical protein DL991_10710 [Amycolatopsis sp. WAC 01375]